jgi:cytochrome c-type biogenesis protein CcmH
MLALLAILATAGSLAAQEPMQPSEPSGDTSALTDPRAAELDARAADIAAKLRCPVCSGQSVLESNSAIAQEMQEVIRERLEQGDGEREVLAYFRGAYGDWIILRPRATGLNLLVYVLPVVALLGGGVGLFVVLRRWSAAGSGRAGESDAAGETDGRTRSVDAPSGDLSAEDESWLRRSIGGR